MRNSVHLSLLISKDFGTFKNKDTHTQNLVCINSQILDYLVYISCRRKTIHGWYTVHHITYTPVQSLVLKR